MTSAAEQIGIDFLQLVRYGLRQPDDPRVQATITAVDALLKTDTPSGPVWHRHTGDAYGEHADGSPFDGSGQGRGWPLLVGERGHYALWAHGEFIKLAVGRHRGAPIDRPPRVYARYKGSVPRRRWVAWSFRLKRRSMPQGLPRRLLLEAPASIRWGCNGWQTTQEIATQDSGLSVHWAQLPVESLVAGETVNFTFRWQPDGKWKAVISQLRLSPTHIASFTPLRIDHQLTG